MAVPHRLDQPDHSTADGSAISKDLAEMKPKHRAEPVQRNKEKSVKPNVTNENAAQVPTKMDLHASILAELEELGLSEHPTSTVARGNHSKNSHDIAKRPQAPSREVPSKGGRSAATHSTTHTGHSQSTLPALAPPSSSVSKPTAAASSSASAHANANVNAKQTQSSQQGKTTNNKLPHIPPTQPKAGKTKNTNIEKAESPERKPLSSNQNSLSSSAMDAKRNSPIKTPTAKTPSDPRTIKSKLEALEQSLADEREVNF